VATLGLPSSPGIPTRVTEHTIVCPYNDVDAAAAAVARYGEGLAAIIVEPVAGNMGVVPPERGFLTALRRLCDGSGALLVFDEVITGFRIARGGAQERYGVLPDLTVLGKIVGGGLPLAAFGGRAEIMDRLAPAGDVYQAGTLSGNPVATAAGLAQLRLLDDAAYDKVNAVSQSIQGLVTEALSKEGVAHRLQSASNMFSVFFTDREVRDYEDAKKQESFRFTAFFHSMLAQGVYLPPSSFESWFVSTAHDEQAVQRIADALPAAARAAAEATAA
jgi:glutamate-1-semialdehyde 2,1-aminomutase